MYALTDDMRRAEYLSHKLPLGSLEADVHEVLERHVVLNVAGSECDDVELYGLEQAALAIVEMLRSKGLVN